MSLVYSLMFDRLLSQPRQAAMQSLPEKTRFKKKKKPTKKIKTTNSKHLSRGSWCILYGNGQSFFKMP